MKKIVFAVQVISLIAMFPIVVVLEMNHSTGRLPEENSPSGMPKKVETTITRSAGKLKMPAEDSIFDFPKNMMLLKTGY